MSRTLSATLTSATAKDATQPIYLIEMGFTSTQRCATYDADITWNGQTWSASGVQLSNLSSSGGKMTMPNGTGDPWLALVMGEGVRDKSISVYEHHTDTTASPQSDAQLIFSGLMDEVTLTDTISVSIIEASRAKKFPALSVDQPTFTFFMPSGSEITWGNDTFTVR